MEFIGKNMLKQFSALKVKKYREQSGMYIVEGKKMVQEALASNNKIVSILFSDKHDVNTSISTLYNRFLLKESDFKRLSSMTTPPEIAAVIEIPKQKKIDAELYKNQLVIALDNIRDPGNLGTIIRLADWFGVKTIISSETSVDFYNPKTVQASMGAVFRVHLQTTNLVSLFSELKKTDQNCFIYGAFLEGENIYTTVLENKGILVMGSESHGISHEIEQLTDKKLFIPAFSNEKNSAESLNVSIATAILCSEFCRTKYSVYQ